MRFRPDKRPKRKPFAWSRRREQETGIVTWRLFRRDHSGAIHASTISAGKDFPRSMVAQHLPRLKRELRELVDEIDLAAMGVEA